MKQRAGWLLRWFGQRAAKTKILIVLLVVATFMGCFGLLTPSSGGSRQVPTPTPGAPRASVPPSILPASATFGEVLRSISETERG